MQVCVTQVRVCVFMRCALKEILHTNCTALQAKAICIVSISYCGSKDCKHHDMTDVRKIFRLKAERMFALLSQDLAMYINEVKRDNETLKKISEFQSSIENLVSTVSSSVTSF